MVLLFVQPRWLRPNGYSLANALFYELPEGLLIAFGNEPS
jgi:hypothetical protein